MYHGRKMDNFRNMARLGKVFKIDFTFKTLFQEQPKARAKNDQFKVGGGRQSPSGTKPEFILLSNTTLQPNRI